MKTFMDISSDIPILLRYFGEDVTFTGPGSEFTCRGIFSVHEEPVIPLDGVKEKPVYTVTCQSEDVVSVTPLFSAALRDVGYQILAVTPNPVMGTTEILLRPPL